MESHKIFVKNQYGVRIVKCCASCHHCHLDKRARICVHGEGAVPPSFVCRDWRMKEMYENVGKGDGKIKRLSYLKYSLERLSDDDLAAFIAAEKKIAFNRVSLSEIRSEYIKKHGSIYENDI